MEHRLFVKRYRERNVHDKSISPESKVEVERIFDEMWSISDRIC